MVDINKLHPEIRQLAINFLASAKLAGIDLRITFGIRTFDEQEKLYNQQHDGVDNDGDGVVDNATEHVTNAQPGQSFHNYGLAIDVIPFVEGKPDWKTKLWPKISELGKAQGFSWGGDWKSFKDLPHFEYPPNTSWKQLMHLKTIGHLDKDGFVILT